MCYRQLSISNYTLFKRSNMCTFSATQNIVGQSQPDHSKALCFPLNCIQTKTQYKLLSAPYFHSRIRVHRFTTKNAK